MSMPTPPDDSIDLRAALIAGAKRLVTSGLTRNTSGNLSHRVADGFLITPTGMAYDSLAPEDIVKLDWHGHPTGRRLPSSEWRVHRDILQDRPEIGVVLHAHPPFATALACHRHAIPPFHYMVAKAGGRDIRCADYATYGTEELSQHVLLALAGRRACLMAHHGIVALGADLDAAFTLGIEVETLAEIYWRARQLGEPPLLSEAEMAIVIAQFRTYGYQPSLVPGKTDS